jgi:transcriptional regulator with XRE-family HTH domain
MPTSSSSEALGWRILQLRRLRDLSQTDLALRIGSTRAQISKYERGAYEPRLEQLGRLADALGTTTDFLITGREPDNDLEALRPRLEQLPPLLRIGLVEFLDHLLHAHDLTSQPDQRS